MDHTLYDNPAARLARIAEMLSAGVRSVQTLTAGIAVKLLSANTRRVAFTIGLASGTNLYIWFDSSVSSLRGFEVNPQQQPRTFSLDADGPWIQSEIWCVGAGATIVLGLVETAIVDGDFDQSDPMYQVGASNGKT